MLDNDIVYETNVRPYLNASQLRLVDKFIEDADEEIVDDFFEAVIDDGVESAMSFVLEAA